MLKNYMEEVVEATYKNVAKDLNVCTCDRCAEDMMAIVLNNMPSRYVVTQKGESYTKLNLLRKQFEIDIIASLAKAAKVINEKPRHN